MKKRFALFLVFLSFASVFFISFISADFFGSWFDESTSKITGQAVAANCEDSDSGKNYFVKGTTSGIDAKTNVQTSQIDRCANRRTLIEYYCDANGKVASVFTAGSLGCSSGICKGTAPTTTSPATTTAPSAGTSTTTPTQQDYDDETNSASLNNPAAIPSKSAVKTTNTLTINPSKKAASSSSLSSSSSCQNLLINGDPAQKVDIVILPDGYLDNSELNYFVLTAKEYFGLTGSVGLLNTEPFKSNKNKFNIYYVDYLGSLGGCYI